MKYANQTLRNDYAEETVLDSNLFPANDRFVTPFHALLRDEVRREFRIWCRRNRRD
jgi:hypothetical protein